uniref:Uncharacterized protein n=1 Tax=Mus musculus TaxID=10090 RepID=Q8CAU6_MOUSE|nr:unnamed protein product [Mus musculus]
MWFSLKVIGANPERGCIRNTKPFPTKSGKGPRPQESLAEGGLTEIKSTRIWRSQVSRLGARVYPASASSGLFSLGSHSHLPDLLVPTSPERSSAPSPRVMPRARKGYINDGQCAARQSKDCPRERLLSLSRSLSRRRFFLRAAAALWGRLFSFLSSSKIVEMSFPR